MSEAPQRLIAIENHLGLRSDKLRADLRPRAKDIVIGARIQEGSELVLSRQRLVYFTIDVACNLVLSDSRLQCTTDCFLQ